MTLTRKDFFRRSLYSLGDTLFQAGGALRGARESLSLAAELETGEPCSCAEGRDAAAPDAPDSRLEAQDPAGPPAASPAGRDLMRGDGERVARADNRHCPAQSCGCFTCAESCAAGAIAVLPGVGIRIDESLCTGCGTCQSRCPLAPRALALVSRADRSRQAFGG